MHRFHRRHNGLRRSCLLRFWLYSGLHRCRWDVRLRFRCSLVLHHCHCKAVVNLGLFRLRRRCRLCRGLRGCRRRSRFLLCFGRLCGRMCSDRRFESKCRLSLCRLILLYGDTDILRYGCSRCFCRLSSGFLNRRLRFCSGLCYRNLHSGSGSGSGFGSRLLFGRLRDLWRSTLLLSLGNILSRSLLLRLFLLLYLFVWAFEHVLDKGIAVCNFVHFLFCRCLLRRRCRLCRFLIRNHNNRFIIVHIVLFVVYMVFFDCRLCCLTFAAFPFSFFLLFLTFAVGFKRTVGFVIVQPCEDFIQSLSH